MGWRLYVDLVKRAAVAWVDDRAPTMGAALAFYSAFSLAPLLIIVIAVGGVFGNDAARVLNCACPLDLDQRAFPVGHCTQSLLGHVGALLYRPAASTFIVMAARSFAADVKRNLQTFVDQTSTITHVGA